MNRTPRAFILLTVVAGVFVLLALLDDAVGDGTRVQHLATIAAIHWVGALVILGVAEGRDTE